MKNIFVDTSIIIDLIAERKPFSKFAIGLLHKTLHMIYIQLLFLTILLVSSQAQTNNIYQNDLIGFFCHFCQLFLFYYLGLSYIYINKVQYDIILFIYFILFRLLLNKVLLFLGTISYALQLIHKHVSIQLIIPIFHKVLGLNFGLVVF